MDTNKKHDGEPILYFPNEDGGVAAHKDIWKASQALEEKNKDKLGDLQVLCLFENKSPSITIKVPKWDLQLDDNMNHGNAMLEGHTYAILTMGYEKRTAPAFGRDGSKLQVDGFIFCVVLFWQSCCLLTRNLRDILPRHVSRKPFRFCNCMK